MAEEHLPMVVVPMPEFVRDREALTSRRAPRIDRDDRVLAHADDPSLAPIELSILDPEYTHVEGDCLKVDVTRSGYPERSQDPFRRALADHTSGSLDFP